MAARSFSHQPGMSSWSGSYGAHPYSVQNTASQSMTNMVLPPRNPLPGHSSSPAPSTTPPVSCPTPPRASYGGPGSIASGYGGPRAGSPIQSHRDSGSFTPLHSNTQCGGNMGYGGPGSVTSISGGSVTSTGGGSVTSDRRATYHGGGGQGSVPNSGSYRNAFSPPRLQIGATSPARMRQPMDGFSQPSSYATSLTSEMEELAMSLGESTVAAAAGNCNTMPPFSKRRMQQLPTHMAPLLKRFNISGACDKSVTGAFQLLEQLGDSWAKDYAIVQSNYNSSWWLLAREGASLEDADIRAAAAALEPRPSKAPKSRHSKALRCGGALEKSLMQHIVGQRHAINTSATHVRRKENGWYPEDEPLVLLFMGPSGTGKTKLAKQLAEYVGEGFIRLDMSEYQKAHEVAKLVGAPPGYQGYEDGGQLTKKLQAFPRAVVLLDEVEKAHPDVLTCLLQTFDEGRLTDGQGHTVDCCDAIFIMTSDLANQEIMEQTHVQLHSKHWDNTAGGSTHEEDILTLDPYFVRQKIMPILKAFFRRDEFLGRIDEILFFFPFTMEERRQLAHKELLVWEGNAKKRHDMRLTWDSVVEHYLADSYDEKFGARSIQHEVERTVVSMLADAHLGDKIAKGDDVHLTITGGQYVLKNAHGQNVSSVEPSGRAKWEEPSGRASPDSDSNAVSIGYESSSANASNNTLNSHTAGSARRVSMLEQDSPKWAAAYEKKVSSGFLFDLPEETTPVTNTPKYNPWVPQTAPPACEFDGSMPVEPGPVDPVEETLRALRAKIRAEYSTPYDDDDDMAQELPNRLAEQASEQPRHMGNGVSNAHEKYMDVRNSDTNSITDHRETAYAATSHYNSYTSSTTDHRDTTNTNTSNSFSSYSPLEPQNSDSLERSWSNDSCSAEEVLASAASRENGPTSGPRASYHQPSTFTSNTDRASFSPPPPALVIPESLNIPSFKTLGMNNNSFGYSDSRIKIPESLHIQSSFQTNSYMSPPRVTTQYTAPAPARQTPTAAPSMKLWSEPSTSSRPLSSTAHPVPVTSAGTLASPRSTSKTLKSSSSGKSKTAATGAKTAVSSAPSSLKKKKAAK